MNSVVFWFAWSRLWVRFDEGLGNTVQAMIQGPQPPQVESILTELINNVVAYSQDFVLILDDYHVIDAHAIHKVHTFLLDHLPPNMHLVISSRSDPLLPIANLRAKSQVAELRAENLRFTTQETTSFLNQVMGLALSADDVAALESRTEGWIAGLNLAALTIREKDDAAKFISEFAGDDRYIVDYLVDEVLSQRPRGTKEFLLQTSILNRINCEIKIRGHLEERWAEWFEGLNFSYESDGTTTLSGPLPDQAALHSILLKIRDMNLTLISVNQIKSNKEKI